MNGARFTLLALLVFFTVATRLIPQPENVNAIGALAIFSGAMFRDRRIALILPLVSLFLSDLVLGLHILIPVVYASFAVNVLISRRLAASRTIMGISWATLLGAIQFALVTNIACWALYHPLTWDGIVSCYILAIPYFLNSFAGDAGYAVMLFGMARVAEAVIPAVRERVVSQPIPVRT